MSDLAQSPLHHYDNARVQVHYMPTSGGLQDSGKLVYRDDRWIELLKDNGERLLIPVSAIRIIKLLEKADPHADAQILLRAATDTPQKQIKGEK